MYNFYPVCINMTQTTNVPKKIIKKTVNHCVKYIYNKDTVNQCVKFIHQQTQSTNVSKIIYQKTQSTNVSNLSTKRHSQPMCQIYLPEDTVNQCVKFIYQKTQSTNVSIYLPTDTVNQCVQNIKDAVNQSIKLTFGS
jgi:hypothetical protein